MSRSSSQAGEERKSTKAAGTKTSMPTGYRHDDGGKWQKSMRDEANYRAIKALWSWRRLVERVVECL